MSIGHERHYRARKRGNVDFIGGSIVALHESMAHQEVCGRSNYSLWLARLLDKFPERRVEFHRGSVDIRSEIEEKDTCESSTLVYEVIQ